MSHAPFPTPQSDGPAPGTPPDPAAASAASSQGPQAIPDTLPQDTSVVRLDGVGVRYGDGPEVLQDVSFALQPGGFYFLTGPSGAGKTTLLRLLYLGLKPTRGQFSLFGRDVSIISQQELPLIRRRIGVVFQDFRLLNHLTAYENVALPLRISGREDKSVRGKVIELLKWVQLGQHIDSRPAELSGGEQQRIAIARAVINHPRLLVADEPTGNVDDAIATRLLFLFEELHRMGTTVVIATHARHLVKRYPYPVLMLQDGQVREVHRNAGGERLGPAGDDGA